MRLLNGGARCRNFGGVRFGKINAIKIKKIYTESTFATGAP